MDQKTLIKYIKGEATTEEIREILIWKKEDESHLNELLALRKMYDLLLWEEEEEESKIISGKRNRKTLFYRIAGIAAAILLLFGGGLMTGLQKQMPPLTMQTIRVPAGQRAEIQLPDGTSVWLNAGTTLTFPNYFTKQREVLLNGQAFFDVTKNKKQPFIVKTHNYNIEVLGTEFDVMAYERSSLFAVSLISGSVEISSVDQAEKIRLEPGTNVYLDNGRLTKERISNSNHLLWKEGVICFDDESVEEMVHKLELYFDTQIIVENDIFKKKRYTGKFRTKDGIEHILRVFQLKDRFIYEKDEEKNVITIR